jgi:UDP-N-acetylmuramoylalanine--D-glutamate ligase
MFKNNKYLVVGLGVTGASVVEYLLKNGAAVTVTDSRAEPPQLKELKQQHPHIEVLLGAIAIPEQTTHIILSPGVALSTPEIQNAIARGVHVLGDIELFAQVVDKPVLAVTGSNGKSTVTTLLGAMATASGLNPGVGGNLGTPALRLLDSHFDCYILELSSFQLETLYSLRPKVVTLLNISPDHMDRYDDLTAYQQAKQRIFLNAEHAVINREDALTAVPADLAVPSVSFGLDLPQANNYGVIIHDGTAWLAKGTTPLMPLQRLAMLGAHNVANALAALAMGEIAGFNLLAMLSTLLSFTGLEHRCEQVINSQGVVWVNDSKGTNVAATVAAIDGLAASIPGKWIIILGGIGKNADFTPLLTPVAKNCKAAILIGAEAPALWDLLHGVLPCYKAQDMAEVVKIANQHAVNGDGVLLSPACASFDMFNNYMHRGEVFKQQVLQRIGKHNATATIG